MEKWSEGPDHWLWGVDHTTKTDDFPKGVPIIWTQDEKQTDNRLVYRPWPSKTELPYLPRFVQDLWYTEEQVKLVDKCRQVLATWAAILIVDWDCRFNLSRKWLLSKTKENEAISILNDKPRFVDKRLPSWVREAMPIQVVPKAINRYEVTDSYLMAVTENVADAEARGRTANLLIDESAFQRNLKNMVAAAIPMETKVIAISTANIANPGGQYMYKLISEGLEGIGL
jgi:hypothetical protein